MSTNKWTHTDQAAAFAQGWGLFTTQFLDRDVVCIQRLDDPDSLPAASKVRNSCMRIARFPDDFAARGYVAGRADAGCMLALKALANIDTAYRCIGSLANFNRVIA